MWSMLDALLMVELVGLAEHISAEMESSQLTLPLQLQMFVRLMGGTSHAFGLCRHSIPF
jgi:hypothetical protein